jgi:hypothetical protein
VVASFGLTNMYIHRRNDQEDPSYTDDLDYLQELGIFDRGK